MNKKSTHNTIILFLSISLLGLGLASCDELSQTKDGQQIAEAIDRVDHILARSQKESVREFKKIYQIEYKTVVLPFEEDNPRTSALMLDETLNNLGRERWSCFSVQKTKGKNGLAFVLLLQRPIDTPLRYLPSGIIGK